MTAKGCPDVPLCWMFDLQLSLSKLCGRLCGSTLDSRQSKHFIFQFFHPSNQVTVHSLLYTDVCIRFAYIVMPKAPTGNDTNVESEFDMFKSELWTTLFRGGYTVGKLQRSFSGRHVGLLAINTVICV